MSYCILCVCLFANSGVQHMLRCFFALFVFVLCLVCPMLSMFMDLFHSWLSLRFSLTFILSKRIGVYCFITRHPRSLYCLHVQRQSHSPNTKYLYRFRPCTESFIWFIVYNPWTPIPQGLHPAKDEYFIFNFVWFPWTNDNVPGDCTYTSTKQLLNYRNESLFIESKMTLS